MRVELVYTPGCTSYKKALHLLETVIAEERLPLYVELHETGEGQKPCIKLDGETLSDSAHHCVEELRALISRRWHDLTNMLVH